MKKQGLYFFSLVVLSLVLLVAGCGNPGAGAKQATPPLFKQTAENQRSAQNATPGVEVKTTECAECHEMAPEVATWQVSSHSQVDCTACHKTKASDYKAKHDSGSFQKPINIAKQVDSRTCKKCHSKRRITTASGDVLIPHDRHDKQGVDCVLCHAGVVHAKVSQRKLDVELDDYSKWNVTVAEKVAVSYYTQPNMWTCISCHKSLKVTTKCSVCHSRISGLPSHEQGAWKTEHGKTGRASIGECTKCHVTPDSPKFVSPSTGDQAADFARANEFCYKCHLQAPGNHVDMRKNHPSIAGSRGALNCFTCHSIQQGSPDSNVTGTFCNQCHWFEGTVSPPAAAPAESPPEKEKKKP